MVARVTSIMRETRFYEYQSDLVVEAAQVYEVASLKHWHASTSYNAPYSGPPVRGGGLAGSIIAWRIDSGSAIILESLLDHIVLRITFPSSLSCLPVIKTKRAPEEVLILASFATDSGCELVLLVCNFPDANVSSENVSVQKTQLAVDEDLISVLHASPTNDDLFFGLASGQCGLISQTHGYQASLELTRFDTPDFSGGADESETGSVSTEFSRHSANSVASKGFISRLLTTPRMLMPSPASQSNTQTSMFNTPRHRGSLPFTTPRSSRNMRDSPPSAADGIEALHTMDLDVPCLVALHSLGRIVVYAKYGDYYQFGGEGKLPLTLAKDRCRQFLLNESQDRIIAVLTVDEDPQANSVRVLSISLKQQITKAVIVSFRSLVKRQGPIDRIVGAVLLGGSIIVGTESGALSGPLNSNDLEENGIGLPMGNTWTAIDDVERPGGLGHHVNAVIEDPRERLLAAHRFSPEVLVKAVRLLDLPNYSRPTVEKRIRSMTFGENEEVNCERAVGRAERLTVDIDMPLHGLQMVPSVGVVAARKRGLFVLRKLYTVEAQALRRSNSVCDESEVLSGPVAWFAASQAAIQVLCANLSVLQRSHPSYKNLVFMIRQGLRFSEVQKNAALTDCIVAEKARQSQLNIDNRNDGTGSEFSKAVELIRLTLEPGGKSLRFLSGAKEMNALRLAAEIAADYVPMSSCFAAGLSWLARYSTQENVIKGISDETVAVEDVYLDDSDPAVLDVPMGHSDTLLKRAYANLVAAAKFAGSHKCRTGDEDTDCVLDLAKLSKTSSLDDQNIQMTLENDADSPLAGIDQETVLEHLGYWLLERSVRLLEVSGAPNSAACAAMEAMCLAPDRGHYETMRAAAFGRFLDAEALDNALFCQLQPPFDMKGNIMCSKDDAGALRDAMGLFVNAVADKDKLEWLVNANLPEPLKTLSAMTLERRARAAEPLNIDSELGALAWSLEEGQAPSVRRLSDYEYLYAWYVANDNFADAASCALEWAERLSTEGLAIVVSATVGKVGPAANDARLRLLLSWARTKVRAFSFALSAVQLLKPNLQYFVRSKFSVLAQESASSPGVVTTDWVSRRQLLAFAQSLCITRMISGSKDENEGGGTVSYLLAHGAPYLQETSQSVTWVLSTLAAIPTPENIQVCAELAAAWVKEHGPQQLVSVVEGAAHVAADSGAKSFNYAQLHSLLSEVRMMGVAAGCHRNWSLIGLKSALGASPGASLVPQWLADQAAWGVNCSDKKCAEYNEPKDVLSNGDVGAVVRAFLMFNQPVNAAKVLLTEFRRARNKMEKSGVVSLLFVTNDRQCPIPLSMPH